MSYGRVHRFLVRTVGSRGVITMAETLRVLSEFTGKHKALHRHDSTRLKCSDYLLSDHNKKPFNRGP